MKEIGGFLEWETYSGAEYHQEALALNSARNALRFLLRARKIRSIWLPRLLCEVIEEVLPSRCIVAAGFSARDCENRVGLSDQLLRTIPEKRNL